MKVENNFKIRVYCIVHNIYRELYKNSIPKGDWDALYKKYYGTKIKFWEQYHCSRKTKEKIISRHLKKDKFLDKITRFNVRQYILKNY